MPLKLLESHVLAQLTRDGWLLFGTRILRLFGYGLVSVVLVLYLAGLGFSGTQTGLLLTLTLVGDTIISLWITTIADRVGRRNMLIVGAVLMLFAGVVFVLTNNFWILLIAATIGVISPSGNEVGPFLAIEQAGLSHLIPGKLRTGIFAWYNLVGSLATASGALVAGVSTHVLEHAGHSPVESYRVVLMGYAVVGGVLAGLFFAVSPAVEVATAHDTEPGAGFFWGCTAHAKIVFKLSALFSLDAFAGGFVLQSLLAYWFHVRFGSDEATLGSIFFAANILAGISALTASRLAARFGLINTMVFTHIPSNILLILVPLMPNLPLAITLLLMRFSISQMDVPTRQAYTMEVVDADERSAAAGVTGVARTTGAAIAPVIATSLFTAPALLSVPFYAAGGLKLIYDLALWRSFKAVRPKAEPTGAAATTAAK